MKYYVYANVERISDEGGAFLKEFDTREEALQCQDEIIYITSHYNTLDELIHAILKKEYTISIKGTWEYREQFSASNNAREWFYNTYSELETYLEGYLRTTINELVVLEGEMINRIRL